MTEAELDELGHACAPTLGSCPGQFTANTMAMVAETLGLAMPGSAMLPAAYSERLALARRAGRRATEIVRDGGPLPRELVTRKSLENACAAVAATGGSTNAGLHLPAIAHEAGIRFTLDDVAAVFARTPLIADLQPGGHFLAVDLHRVGGVGVVLKALLDRRPPARRRAHALRAARSPRSSPARPRPTARWCARADRRAARHRRRRGAQGQPRARWRADQGRRPEERGVRRPGARVRVRGRRLCRGQRTRVQAGDVLVIRNEGPRGGPGMREMLGVTALVYGQGMGEKVALHHRRSLLRRDARPDGRLHRPRGGARRADRAGARRRPDPHRWRGAHARRCASAKPRWHAGARHGDRAAERERLAGVLEKYAKLVGPAHLGAVTHSGPADAADER